MKLSKTSSMHYSKLIFRSVLLLAALWAYVNDRMDNLQKRCPHVFMAIWVVFAVEIFFRFFPSDIESMGCQKQFARNYKPRDNGTKPEKIKPLRVAAVVAAWLALNGIIGILYHNSIIDEGVLFLICLLYSVCDMICILFFCPFQTWFLHNKCCGSCRIYNWDYAMMFTPLSFVKGIFAKSLLFLGLSLLIVWEIRYFLHPERFYESTNLSLTCANCTEKLCTHKKQLRTFLLNHYNGVYWKNSR